MRGRSGRQIAELHIRIAFLNRFSALGTAETEPLAQTKRGKGYAHLNDKFYNTQGIE